MPAAASRSCCDEIIADRDVLLKHPRFSRRYCRNSFTSPSGFAAGTPQPISSVPCSSAWLKLLRRSWRLRLGANSHRKEVRNIGNRHDEFLIQRCLFCDPWPVDDQFLCVTCPGCLGFPWISGEVC